MGKMSPSPLGRLLEEISWEGNARHYREGGRGYENVLTAEVLQALDFLPRKAFLGRILESLPGEVPTAAKLLAQEVEDVSFSLLPGGLALEHSSSSIESPLEVQPDAILESPSVYWALGVWKSTMRCLVALVPCCSGRVKRLLLRNSSLSECSLV